nr:probable receptor-like protein kinase At2g23200 [Tanacetum cinerariifolium]
MFLNGLKIMDLLTNSGVDGLQMHGKENEKKLHIVIRCVVRGVVLELVLGFLIGSQYWKSKLVEDDEVSGIKVSFRRVLDNMIPHKEANLADWELQKYKMGNLRL